MKKILKYLISTLSLIVVFALTSCAQFNIDAKITEDNFVSFSYILEFIELDKEDANYNQIELFLLDVKEHWEENGVVGHIETSDNSVRLTGKMEKQCETREDAFNTLYSFMTNEVSVFDNASLNYYESDYKAEYKLEFSIDMTGIVDEQIYESHPAIVDEDVNEFIKEFKCNISFSLPYNDDPKSLEISQKVSENIIPLDAPFNSIVDGIVLDNFAKENKGNLFAEKDRLERSIKIFAVVAGVSLVGIIILIVLRIVIIKKKKITDNHVKSEE
ncbi:MAG: hypothetical protein AB1Z23_00255 [Eubacteriales bacterium]